MKKLQKMQFAKLLLKETNKCNLSAMEALIHNLDHNNSRAGLKHLLAQLIMELIQSEGQMVIENILLANEAGLGNGETPIFQYIF